MALEIERKFRVAGDGWQAGVVRQRRLRQAYLSEKGTVSVRVRIDEDRDATLTIKAAAGGIERHEYEYAIPLADAEELIKRPVGVVIEKTRHFVPAGDMTWEIDVFGGQNAGLVLAEVELTHADQPLERPNWLGEEVTADRRFYNADLARRPFSTW